ncbi:MAG: Response regulator receiver domain [Gemmatimonadetes bacterium]|nr:Response regulator receiver domain [Gemmatimonadota bacterium]
MDTKDNTRPAIVRMPRVLVVEDNADTLVVLGKLLLMIPADAIPTASCDAAREAAATVGPFDVVIADVKLPDGDGIALAVALNRLYGSAVVIMSAFDPPAAGMPEGVDLWLPKPVRLPELRRAMQSLAKA